MKTHPASVLRVKHGARIGNALNVLNLLIAKGIEYPDAESRVQLNGGYSETFMAELRAAYDAQCGTCEKAADGLTCDDMFNCCNCGGNNCGCRYCWACNACDACKEAR